MISSQLMVMVIGVLWKEEMMVMKCGLWFLKRPMLRCMDHTTILRQEKFNMPYQIWLMVSQNKWIWRSKAKICKFFGKRQRLSKDMVVYWEQVHQRTHKGTELLMKWVLFKVMPMLFWMFKNKMALDLFNWETHMVQLEKNGKEIGQILVWNGLKEWETKLDIKIMLEMVCFGWTHLILFNNTPTFTSVVFLMKNKAGLK